MKTRILKYLTVIGLVLFFLAFAKPAYSQTFTFTPNTSGVTTNTTLVGGQTGVVLLGTTIATSANTTITSAIINFSTTGSISGNPIAFFPNAKLYESTSGTFASATQISTASFGQSGSNIVCSTNANLTFNTGTSYTFYLVADINASNCCGVLPMTTTLNFSQIYSYSPSVTYTNSSSGTGVTYTLATGTISVTGYNSTSNGISTPNLLYGQTNIVLFGFAITAQGSLSINQIFIPSTTTGANIFTNGKLYRSTTGPTFSSASVISGASVNFNYGTNGVNITGLSETFTATAATTVYYFLVGDFTASTSYTAPTTIQYNFTSGQSPAALLQSSPYTTFNTFTTTNGQVFTLGATYNWVGSSNTDFGNASNFRSQNGSTVSATPTSTDQVQIGVTSYQYPYNQPTVGVNTAVAKIIIGTNNTPAITVSSGVTLTISGIGGGTATPLTFNSSAALTVNGPGTFSLGGPTTIPSGSTLTLGPTSVLSLANSTSTLTNNGTLNLLSTAAGSAAIAAIPSGASISGSANIQRFITGTNSTYRSYRLLTSPVNLSTSSVPSTNISLSYINTTQTLSGTVYHGALTGGPGGTGSGFSVFNANPTMYLYNESLASSNSGFTSGKPVGIVAIGSSTISTLSKGVTTTGVSVPVANGYFFYFIGDNSTTATAPTRVIQGTAITASGYINQGNVPVKIWNTPTSSYLSYASLVNPGFNLIGNPYPCAIDLNQVYADNSTSTGFTTFWIALDQNPGQQFVSYNAQSGARSNTTYSSQYIASGQGFLVQATATNQSITFKETEKAPYAALSSTSSPVLQLSLHQSESLSLKSTTDNTSKTLALTDNPAANSGLHLKLSADSITNDECGIYFSSKWSDNYDNNDAYDLDGISPTVYLSSLTANGVRVGINSLGSYLKGKKVKLFVKASATGSYNLRLADIENIDTALFDINLIDNSAKDSVDILRSSKGYTFTITTTDTTTFGTERFVLSVQRKPLPPYQLLSFAGQKATGGIALNWKTENEGTYTGFSIQKLIGNADYTTLYSVQSNSAGTYSYTDPNPVTGNNVYRLMQNNIDSINTYSKPINVVYNIASPLGLLTVYPNPAKDQITINFNSAAYNQPVSGNYQTSIYNSTGIAVIKKSTSGNSSWSQDITALQPGSYVIEVKSNDGSLIGNAKFVKYQ